MDGPFWARPPVPVMTEDRRRSVFRFTTSWPLLTRLIGVTEPVAPPVPSWRDPAAMVTSPVKVASASRDSAPRPDLVRAEVPAPPKSPARVTSLPLVSKVTGLVPKVITRPPEVMSSVLPEAQARVDASMSRSPAPSPPGAKVVVPPDSVSLPVKLLLPRSSRLPGPVLVRVPEPETSAPRVMESARAAVSTTVSETRMIGTWMAWVPAPSRMDAPLEPLLSVSDPPEPGAMVKLWAALRKVMAPRVFAPSRVTVAGPLSGVLKLAMWDVPLGAVPFQLPALFQEPLPSVIQLRTTPEVAMVRVTNPPDSPKV